ncbi:uncharacterized protein LOC130411855 [Triplophysa dalaica]|uniref:uncharacterized protein LOC130411855 n=1 Tax=Triplophysa dalaica TaxID=1582913 RepID=UPI0024DF52EA|nr:uncharacterized protein LOC130411855 [Triplophysa dalaica]
MTENRQLNFPEHDNNDEDCDILYTRTLRKKGPKIKFEVSTDINKKLLKSKTWKPKKSVTKKPTVQVASAHVDIIDIFNIIDTYDRAGHASAESTFARCGTFTTKGFENKSGQRLSKAGVYAEAGVGRARAEFSVFDAEANGPNASVSAIASLGSVGVSAMARAEITSVSARAGPVGVKLGLGVDTGASIGLGGVEAKFLGTGISIGPKTSVSVLGSEVSCSVM